MGFLSISRAQSFNFFTPRNLCFTGWIFADFSRERLLFHGLFLRNFHGYDFVFTGGKPIFFTGYKKFFTEKKKPCELSLSTRGSLDTLKLY